MYKITKIKPVGAQNFIAISSIEADFLTKIKAYFNPFTELESCIRNRSLKVKNEIYVQNLNADQLNSLTILRNNFDQIVVGSPSYLESFINSIDNVLFGEDMKTKSGMRFVASEFGRGVSAIFGYEDYFRSQTNKGLWLAKQLNIKSCPYCNAQYTLTIQQDSRPAKAKFQFDHFFSKKRYPYLSISLYNLIPSCAPCNLSKSDLKTSLRTHVNPYHRNLAHHSKFYVDYTLDIGKLSIADVKTLNFKTTIKAIYDVYDKLIEEHNRIFEIEGVFNRHHDIIEDLLYKAIVKNNSFKEDIMEVKGLFDGDERLYRRYLIGNYALEEEIHERPLSKFTQDLARQFKII